MSALPTPKPQLRDYCRLCGNTGIVGGMGKELLTVKNLVSASKNKPVCGCATGNTVREILTEWQRPLTRRIR